MIDELAKAICAEQHGDWDECGERFRAYYRAQVIAVLRRLREPTPEMIEATAPIVVSGVFSVREVYTAMIDAAIGEAK
jgi:hypothetical protein